MQTLTEKSQGPEARLALNKAVTKLMMNHPLMKLNTEYQAVAHLQKYCGLVSPVEIVLGDVYEEHGQQGDEVMEEIEKTALIVPFEESLAQLFRNDEFRHLVKNRVPSVGDQIRSVFDSKSLQKNEFFNKNPNALIVQMYFDDVELVNPLGSRTGVHKVTNFYFSILNIPEYLRSSLKSIGLIACVLSDQIKKYGYKQILENFFSCIEKLMSEDGMKLQLREKETLFVHGLLFCLCGDGLALNHIGGFKGIGGANHPCRNCLLSKHEMKTCFIERNLRSRVTHNEHVQQISNVNLNVGEREELKKQLGVSGPSPLDRVENFDVTKQLVQDKMHNILEGAAEVSTRALLNFMLKPENSDLKLDTLNDKIQSFAYPPELMKNKPSLIMHNHLKLHLRQKASQMLCLICVLPIILAPFESEKNSDYLLNFSLLVQITHRLFAYEVRESSLSTIKLMIVIHHTKFIELYPNISMTPKFHFMVHGPTTIENFGPCRVGWCMRYEGMNAWFSQAAGQTNNFINITKTLTNRFLIRRCLDLGLGDKNHKYLSEKIFKPELCNTINLKNYEMGQQVANCLGIDVDNLVNCASSIYLKNFNIAQKKTILVFKDSDDDALEFCRVKAIFVRESRAVLVVNILETETFDELRCAFCVKKTDRFTCKLSDDFPSLQPFPFVHTNDGDLVVPLYYDVRVFIG